MSNDIVPEMLTIKETSLRCGLSYNAIRKMCLNNQIIYIRCGSKFLINWHCFCEFLNTSHGGGETL